MYEEDKEDGIVVDEEDEGDEGTVPEAIHVEEEGDEGTILEGTNVADDRHEGKDVDYDIECSTTQHAYNLQVSGDNCHRDDGDIGSGPNNHD
ncbi:hypothetical protein ACE6H2_020250 [Prunus campanulata]